MEEGWTDSLLKVFLKEFSPPLQSVLNEIWIKLESANRNGSLLDRISGLDQRR
jgi:hypothetical protein